MIIAKRSSSSIANDNTQPKIETETGTITNITNDVLVIDKTEHVQSEKEGKDDGMNLGM